jgi:Tfp pilus assembly protein PilE
MINNKGFTRVEFIVVIIILIVLAVIAAPIYKKYINESVLSEGKALISTIQTAETVYYAEFGKFYAISDPVDNDRVLNVDASSNSIFKKFMVKTSNNVEPKTYEIIVFGNKNGKEIILNLNDVEDSNLIEVLSE